MRRFRPMTALMVLACVALTACTSSTTTTGKSSPQQFATSRAPSTSAGVQLTSASARTLVANAPHVDAETYQTGSFSPTVEPTRMPHVVQFTTPSGNIRCTWSQSLPSLLMCSIDSFDFPRATRPTGCTLNWVTGAINLTAHIVTIGQCLGGPQVTYRSRVLPYGSAIQALGIGCYSGTDGLTCVVIDSGRGFTVSKAAFTTF